MRRKVAAAAPVDGSVPALSGEQRVELYRAMLRIRTLDERMMTLQRQGRIGFYGSCTGQEAACLASAYALGPTDWIFPALREGAAMLLRGFPLVPYIAQVFGNSGDVTKGRQMPSHQAARALRRTAVPRPRATLRSTPTFRGQCFSPSWPTHPIVPR